jgi:PAS domain S-box-containing protein
MDAAPVMIWVSGQDKLCTWFNRPWLDFTGRAMEQELGNGWADGVHPDDFDRCLQIYVQHFDARLPFRMQYRLRRNDGAYRWIDDTGVPRRADDGTFIGYIGSCTDVHALEERIAQQAADLAAQAELHAGIERERVDSERLLRTLVEGLKDCAIYMLDAQGCVTSWNSGAQSIKGYAAEEILGQHYSHFFTDEDRRADVPGRVLREAADKGKYEAEGWRLRKDGSRFWASAVIDAIHDEHGRLIGFAKVTRDFTERHETQQLLEQTRERLLQTQKMEAVGQLTGGVAHDFNNLLTIILGNLETAQRNLATLDPSVAGRLTRLLGNAMRGAQRATTLTQRLLAFSRRQPLDPKPMDLNKFAAGAVDFLQRSLGETVDIEAVGGAGVWPVEVDAPQLEAALLNLAVNARDAMPDGGKLTIETSNAFLDEEYCRAHPEVAPGQYVLIAVSDTGVGMSEEIQARAFEPFYTTKGVGHGTGLGLSQVYGFVKQSGGHVKIYSEIGEGTTVKIYLPRLTKEPRKDEGPQSVLEHVEGQTGETILLVEDDGDVRAYLAEVLRELNYRVLDVPDAVAACGYLEQGDTRIDLLLTDVVLPGLNGRQLAERARQIVPDLRVLFMTGYSRNAIVHQGRLDPGVQVIQKPITQEALAVRIRDLIDAPR